MYAHFYLGVVIVNPYPINYLLNITSDGANAITALSTIIPTTIPEEDR